MLDLTSQLSSNTSGRRKLLVPYLTIGYPTPHDYLALCQSLHGAGADLLEVGVPFSDPMADGPVIQHSSKVALSHGILGDKLLALIADTRARSPLPLVAMSYLNPLLRNGLEHSLRQYAAAGVSGIIIPDLPPEQSEEYLSLAARFDLAPIFLVAPTTREPRLKLIAEQCRGYVYLVSLTGTTGAQTKAPQDLTALVDRIRAYTSLPIVAGFGISTPEQAAHVAAQCDGVIVGSALINTMRQAIEAKQDPVTAAVAFLKAFRTALDALPQ